VVKATFYRGVGVVETALGPSVVSSAVSRPKNTTIMMTTMTLLVRPGECLILAARCLFNTLFMVLLPPMTWTEARQPELNLSAKQMSKLNSRTTAKKEKEGGVTVPVG